MLKKIVLFLALPTFVALYDARVVRRNTAKLNSRHIEEKMKVGMQMWRKGFVEGFDDCNRRLIHPIPRSEYPKFD